MRALLLTPHATTRLSQRNFDLDDLSFIMDYGLIQYRAGACWYVLRESDLPVEERRCERRTRLTGAVVCEVDGVVTTIYRNDHPLRHIGRKAPHDNRVREPEDAPDEFGFEFEFDIAA